jgi:hypothetical protein
MTSELRVDNLKGSTTGGSINVLGEGTSATTNLQQGLCKMWLNVADNSTNNDSLNVSSVADTAAGRQKIAITNPFRATTTMSGAGSANETDGNNGSTNNNRAAHFCRGDSTSEAFLNTFNCSGGASDDVHLSSGLMNGDLA